MRPHVLPVLEKDRIREGPLASDPGFGLTGAFMVRGPSGATLAVVASLDVGWEHVSVSHRDRCPNWPEMHWVKGLFWGEDEAVMQLHPPERDYVNCHPFCLHLWRPTSPGVAIPLPPSWMVGPKPAAVRLVRG